MARMAIGDIVHLFFFSEQRRGRTDQGHPSLQTEHLAMHALILRVFHATL